MPDDIRIAADPRHCTGADTCAWPGLCLPGRCIAHARSNLAALAPHCPPGLALLRGLPGEWTEPPDRCPRPRHLPRGGHLLGALAWALLCLVAIGGAAWLLHWLIFN